jgi:hypothetical protein
MPILWRRISIIRVAGLQQVLAVEQDLAAGRFDQPRQAAHQRRLAGSRQPHDDEDLALADVRDRPARTAPTRPGRMASVSGCRHAAARKAARRQRRTVSRHCGRRAWLRERHEYPVGNASCRSGPGQNRRNPFRGDRQPGGPTGDAGSQTARSDEGLLADPLRPAGFVGVIHSPTTSSTVLPSRSTSVIIAPISSLSMVNALIAS